MHDGVTEEQFVSMRKVRDATLAMLVLVLPSGPASFRPRTKTASDLRIPLNALHCA